MYAMFKRRGLVVTRKCWAELTRSERRATQELGCDEQLWDSNANLPALHEIATWRRFTPAQCHAAAVLGLRQPEGNIEEVAAEEEEDEDLFEMEKIVVRSPSPHKGPPPSPDVLPTCASLPPEECGLRTDVRGCAEPGRHVHGALGTAPLTLASG